MNRYANSEISLHVGGCGFDRQRGLVGFGGRAVHPDHIPIVASPFRDFADFGTAARQRRGSNRKLRLALIGNLRSLTGKTETALVRNPRFESSSLQRRVSCKLGSDTSAMEASAASPSAVFRTVADSSGATGGLRGDRRDHR